MSNIIPPRTSSVSFIDNLYAQAVEYAKSYHLPDTFVWYCVGAAYNTVGMSSSMFGDFLDYNRKEFDEMRERFDTNSEHEKKA